MKEKREHFARNMYVLQDSPLKTAVNNKYNFTFKSQDGLLPLQWKYSQACACSKESKYVWSLATLLCSLSEGKKTINIICCSISQSGRFVGNLEFPPWVIKHCSMIPHPGALPHTYALISPGSWTKLDLNPLSQLRTLGSIFCLGAYFKCHYY